MKTSGVEAWELEKIRRQLRRQLAMELQGTLRRAIFLAQNAVFYNDPLHVNSLESKISAVTAEDVRRVACRYLTETNRTVVFTLPKKSEAPGSVK